MGGLHNTLYRAVGRQGRRDDAQASRCCSSPSRGRKTGKQRTVPLLYGRDGDRYVVIASKGGDAEAPRLVSEPPGAGGRAAGRQASTVRVRARDAEGEERERLWAMMVGLYPPYAEYQQKTSRQIPVVVLEPLGTV